MKLQNTVWVITDGTLYLNPTGKGTYSLATSPAAVKQYKSNTTAYNAMEKIRFHNHGLPKLHIKGIGVKGI